MNHPVAPRLRLAPLAGACLAAAAGLLCHFSNLAAPLERLSYDLPFTLQAQPPSKEIALVYLDEDAARVLQQPLDSPWDRRLFARLVDRLQRDGARTVVFDLLFSTPSSDPQVDADFARAMRAHGGVILGGDFREHEQFGVQVTTLEKATPELRQAQAGWGLLILRPIDPDGAIRQICTGRDGFPSASWTAAVRDGAPLPPKPTDGEPIRWLNYHGPSGKSFESVSIADALREDGVPPGFFKGRTIFVGGRYSTGSLMSSKDQFGNPYSRWGRRFSPGVEIHATACLNLLHGDWLRCLSPGAELLLFVLLGALAGGGLTWLQPGWAAAAAIAGALAVAAAACASAWTWHVWFAWMVPVGVQLPLALAWSIGSQYFVEQRRRTALRQAFGFYLSPQMADRIANSEFDLKPGGKMAEATVMFTDLESFSTLSEKISPQELSEILIAYFTQTTSYILESNGTIIKYIGDAVMATWGVPLPDKGHAVQAARAASLLGKVSNREVLGHQLRTRIGINTGQVLAGNLGSPFRFDYTLIGDAVNFASRLEGMNKFLGTQILVSEATFAQLGGRFVTRALGRFVVKGLTKPVGIYELVGPAEEVQADDCPWLGMFAQGLAAYQAGRFEDAAACMKQTILLHDGDDGPAKFYLKQIARRDPAKPHDGTVRMEEK